MAGNELAAVCELLDYCFHVYLVLPSIDYPL